MAASLLLMILLLAIRLAESLLAESLLLETLASACALSVAINPTANKLNVLLIAII